MTINRRSILVAGGGVVTTAVAGCIGNNSSTDDVSGGDSDSGGGESDRDDDGVPDSEDAYPDDPDRSAKDTSTGRIDVNEDEWYQWSLEWESETHLEYEMLVRDGPSIDLILFDESEYSYYENEERASYYTTLSDLDTVEARAGGWLEAGEYRLVVDNTNYGEAAPPTDFDDNVAEIEYTITISR